MQAASRIQVNIELLDIFFETRAPFDVIMSKFFRNNRWIGGADRREIAKTAYDVFRNFEKIRFYTKPVTANFGRAHMLAYLKKILERNDISAIFSGEKYHPAPLSDFEKRFLRALDNNGADLPKHAVLNYPEWMENVLQKAFPTDFSEELQALNAPADVILRVNTLKTNRDDVMDALRKSGAEAEFTVHAPNGIRVRSRMNRGNEVLRQSMAEVQDEGSQLIAANCEPEDAKIVADFCAGAGGKTLALAALMKNKGRIFALDKHPQRLKNAQIRCRRAGVDNVTCMELSNKWLKRHVESADAVLVDAPCSGTGTWRRNPDMRAKFQQQDLLELIALQREILSAAADLVKPEGRLIYATCSVLREENEEQIQNFLQNRPDFSLIKVKYHANEDGFMRLSPYRDGTDGFFTAVMKRSRSISPV